MTQTATDALEGKLLLTVPDVAGLAGVEEATVRRWLRDKRLNGVKPGGDKSGWRIARAEVHRFLGLSQ